MCYEAAIASAGGGDEATLTKSLILLNIQGFQAKLDTEEDFLSRAQ
jgi:hypothetical protein